MAADNRQAIDEKFVLMTTAPVQRLIGRFAVPSIVIMLVSAFYNMADTYFVGSLGTSATAAVGVVFALMAVIQAVGFFFGHGAGNFISRELGAQNVDNASKMAATGFFSALIAGGCIAVAGLVFAEPLARLLGSTDTILPHAIEYMRFILLGAPFMASSLMLNNLLRFQGSAFYGMIGMVTGAVLNIALDPMFIFVCDMGVAGAGLATMLSQAVSCILLLVGCTRKGNVRIQAKNFAPSPQAYKEMLRGGSPSLFRQGLSSVAAIVLNQLAGVYGDAAIAAMTIVQRVVMVAGSALIGFGQGFQPVCGFNYGAGLYDRVKKAFWFCIKVSTVALAVLTVIFYLLAPQVVAVFRADDAVVVEIGTLALRMQCLTFPLWGWITLCNMMFQTIGKAVRASLIAVARQGLFLLVFLLMLTPTLGLFGLQLSQPCADVATFILSIPLYLSIVREMAREKRAARAEGESA